MLERHTNDLFPKLCKKVGSSLKRYRLLQHDDIILIGLSGGKDSLFLLESMADRIKTFAVYGNANGLLCSHSRDWI